jgi:hypothetical protein
MAMYVHAQKSDSKKEKWLSYDRKEKDQVTRTHSHISVYDQSERKVDGVTLDYTKVKLQGDLIIDIDAKDLGQAITWVNRLLDYLQSMELNLDYVKVWCSGSKGFHVQIPHKVFGEDKPMVQLNKYHKWMVAKISIEADIVCDMALYYSIHLIRCPGIQRLDGRWKVPVTIEETRSMTPGEYIQLVQSPRTLSISTMVPDTYFCEKMGSLWVTAKQRVKAELDKQAKQPGLSDEQLDVFTDDKLPQCVEWMRDHSSVKGSFNDTQMQLATFLAHAGNVSQTAVDKLIHEFAKNHKSDSRPSLNQRIDHVRTTVRWAEGGCKNFSCAGARSVLSGNPCTGCPIKVSQQDAAELETSIEAAEDGYYIVSSKNGRRKFTTFTMERISQINSWNSGNVIFHADVFEVSAKTNGGTSTSIIHIPAEDWTSTAAFKKQISKVAGAVMLTSGDAELANLQNYLNSTQVAEVLLRVEQAGIHVIKTGEKEQRFWAEPDWSLDAGGTSGQHMYSGDAGETVVSLRGIDTAKATDDAVVDVLDKLMNSNRPDTVGQLLGWAAACHLKEHLYKAGFYNFPLMHLAGQPGSGKSSTAVVYSALTGSVLRGGPMVVDTTTPSPLRQALTQTTTIARVYDEFNKPSLALTKYLAVLGILKAAYCRQNMAMGYVSKGKIGDIGPATKNQFATAPVIYMSRVATENEELLQRSVVLQFEEDDHYIGNYRENFLAVEQSLQIISGDGHPIQKLTKLLVKNAIETPVEQVHKWYEESKKDLPMDEHTRRIHNLFAIRLGLKFLGQCLSSFPTHITSKLQELDQLVVSTWRAQENTAADIRRKWSPTETLVSLLDMMSKIPEADRTPGKIGPGHYIKSGSTLYISPDRCFPAYRLFTKAIGQEPEAGSPAQMTDILKKAKYCLGVGGTPGQPDSRGWVALDLSQMRERGINGEGFAES